MSDVIPTLPPLLDLGGTAVFALSGALMATRLKQTFVTAAFFALVTGVGGGTIRDVLVGVPAFWLENGLVPLLVLFMALIAWFTPRRWWDKRMLELTLEWADALRLAAFATLGAAKAMAVGGMTPLPAAVLGIITGCAGGIIRDVIAGQPSIIMRPELYVTAAALSAGLCAGLLYAGMEQQPAMALAALAGFALRGAAMIWRIELPAFSRDR